MPIQTSSIRGGWRHPHAARFGSATTALVFPPSTGATLGVADGHNSLYVTNFHAGRVETYNKNFHQVNPHGFVDGTLPAGYAPFGIRNINGEIFVTYALQDAQKEDDVAGLGNGFVNVFDTSGNFLRRLVSNGNLNAPWGLALVEGNSGSLILATGGSTLTIRQPASSSERSAKPI